mmetsp:Transcript_38949/g.120371  ORF Transcript_38949/g.120371 Transcript_38949/m.120371 type:complete len:301 (-) Transcript_38949:265-1167(-)
MLSPTFHSMLPPAARRAAMAWYSLNTTGVAWRYDSFDRMKAMFDVRLVSGASHEMPPRRNPSWLLKLSSRYCDSGPAPPAGVRPLTAKVRVLPGTYSAKLVVGQPASGSVVSTPSEEPVSSRRGVFLKKLMLARRSAMRMHTTGSTTWSTITRVSRFELRRRFIISGPNCVPAGVGFSRSPSSCGSHSGCSALPRTRFMTSSSISMPAAPPVRSFASTPILRNTSSSVVRPMPKLFVSGLFSSLSSSVGNFGASSIGRRTVSSPPPVSPRRSAFGITGRMTSLNTFVATRESPSLATVRV